MNRKYNPIKDKKISGIAGPVINAIGIKIKKVEKNKISLEIVLSVNKDLKGKIKKLLNTVTKSYIGEC